MKDNNWQFTSLELAKELKKSGYPQEGLWMWVKYELWKEPKLWLSDMSSQFKTTCLSGKREYEFVAPTVAELGERLPNDKILEYISKKLNGFSKTQDKCLAYIIMDLFKNPNALVKIWLYLKKEKLL